MKDHKGTQVAGNKGTPERDQLKELSKEEMEKAQGGRGGLAYVNFAFHVNFDFA
jgi:hypothetical protein